MCERHRQEARDKGRRTAAKQASTHQVRIAAKKARGECVACSKQAVPGLGRCQSCRDKAVERSRAYYEKNASVVSERSQTVHRDRNRNWALLREYGITLDDYNTMLVKQAGTCRICKQPETAVHTQSGRVRNLAVDHDHKTGRVRGLLCHRCNRVLGLIGDETEWLRTALRYLR